MNYLIVIFCFLTISGCSSFTSPARNHELDGSKSYWLDYDATRRGTLVSNGATQWKYCAEPTPDAVMNMIAKLGGSVNVASQGSLSGNGELNQSIIKLAERTQMVMFLRESMYRLCELSLNSNLTPEQMTALYDKVIQSSVEVVKTEKLIAEKERLDAAARLKYADQAQFIYSYLHDKNVDPAIIQSLLKDMK